MDKDKFPTKITVKQHTRILVEIKEKLEDWELDLFRRYCFGHFLDFDPEWFKGGKTGKWNTIAEQYVYFLILRCMKMSKKKELWFLVEQKLAQFSLMEFAMVSSLRCSRILKISNEQSFKLKNQL